MKTKMLKKLGLGGVILGLFFIVVQIVSLPGALPEIDELKSISISDREGRQISHILSVRGEYVSEIALEDIPTNLQHVFIVSEDKRFYTHRGIDVLAILRSLVESARHFRIVSGASTIPMQLTRIFWPRLGKFYLKPAQMIQAYRIERNFTKGEILQLYLNFVPFAHQVVGVHQGCLYFFDKSCNRLSLAEAASLAVIPRNPAFYTHNPQKLKQARNRLIKRAIPGAHWDSLTVQQALREDIKLIANKPQQFAPHLVQRIQQEEGSVKNSGIATTIDLSLQKHLQSLMKEAISKRPGLGDSAAILVVENSTAEILAYVGGPDFYQSGFGMVDGVKALRSPGSALKPFVYALALENGWTLSSILPDMPISFKTEKGVFSPSNYGGNFSGPRQLRFALANSMNIPAILLTSQLGETKVLKKLREFGFENLNEDPEHYGLGVSLGNGEVSLWELVQAYSTLARKGDFKKIHYLKNSQQPGDHEWVTTPEVSYLISDVLSDSQARSEEFGRGGPLEFDFKVAVKTGTSSDYRDHLTIGYTNDYTVGIWRGNSNGQPMQGAIPAARNTGRWFHTIMNILHEKKIPKWFPKPAGIFQQKVCSITGLLPNNVNSATRLELFLKDSQPLKRSQINKTIFIPDCIEGAREISYTDNSDFMKWNKVNHGLSLEYQLESTCGLDADRVAFYLEKAAIKKTNEQTMPSIIKPAHNTVYAIDPTIPVTHQSLKLEFDHVNRAKDVQLLIDDEFYKLPRTGEDFFWPLSKGFHTFELKKGDKIIGNTIKIQVL